MPKKLIIIAICLLFGFTLANSVNAQTNNVPYQTENPSNAPIDGIQYINPVGVPWIVPAYNSTTVTLTYVEAINYSITPYSMDTHHYETQSPTGMTFVADGIGSYTLHLQVSYDRIVEQVAFLTVISGNGQTFPFPINVNSQGFALDLTIVTSIEPHPATPEEVWEYGGDQQARTLMNMSDNFQAQQQQATIIQYATIGSVAVTSIILIMVIRHQRRQDRRFFDWEKLFHAKGIRGEDRE